MEKAAPHLKRPSRDSPSSHLRLSPFNVLGFPILNIQLPSHSELAFAVDGALFSNWLLGDVTILGRSQQRYISQPMNVTLMFLRIEVLFPFRREVLRQNMFNAHISRFVG